MPRHNYVIVNNTIPSDALTFTVFVPRAFSLMRGVISDEMVEMNSSEK
jgi:hypothetical protein